MTARTTVDATHLIAVVRQGSTGWRKIYSGNGRGLLYHSVNKAGVSGVTVFVGARALENDVVPVKITNVRSGSDGPVRVKVADG